MVKRKKYKILVNAITLSRVVASFLIVPIYLKFGSVVTSIFAAIMLLTDTIDGKLARGLHVESFFGSLVDSLADKILGGVILFILSYISKLYLIPLILEVLIIIVNFVSMLRKNNIKTSFIGKCKTTILDVCIVLSLFLLYFNALDIYISYLSIPVIISEVVVLLDYIIIFIKQDKIKKEKINSRRKNKKELMFALFDTDYFINNRDGKIRNLFYVDED